MTNHPPRSGSTESASGSLWGVVFRHELQRLARQPGLFRQRLALGLLLLGLMGMVYRSRVDAGPDGVTTANILLLSELGFAIISSELMVLYACTLVITPILVAGLIVEERRRRTLELLMTTAIPAWSILVGKVAARCLQPLALVLMAVPIVAITQVWGGVDGLTILAHLLTTLLAIAGMASVSAAVAIQTRSVRATLARVAVVYGAVLLLATLAAYLLNTRWPLALLANVPWVCGSFQDVGIWWQWLGWVLATHGLIAGLAGAYALANFDRHTRRLLDSPTRRDATPPPARPRPTPPPARTADAAAAASDTAATAQAADRAAEPPRSVATPLRFAWPTIGEDALWWKEHYYESGLDRRVMWRRQAANAAGALCLPMGMCVLSTLLGEPGQTLRTSPVLIAFNVLFFTLVLLLAAARLAASVAAERTRDTLTTLLLLPCERRWLLRAKFWGGLLALRYAVPVPLVTVLICWSFAVAMGGLDASSAVLLVGMLLAHTAFAGSVGLWWSVRSDEPDSAVRLTLSSLLITQLPLALMGLLSARFAESPTVQAVLAGLSMPSAWVYATFCPVGVVPEETMGRGQLAPTIPPISPITDNIHALSGIVSIALYTGLSVLLLRAADRAFATEADRA
jgi:ABC-type transport system involved in multi-copper enzyme maturation permease subunit